MVARLPPEEVVMRMMLRWTVPVDRGNAMISDGSMGTLTENPMELLQPEAACLLADGGEPFVTAG